VTAEGASPGARYVRSVSLNGKPLTQPWFYHKDIANGGTLSFKMGSGLYF